MPQFYFNVYDDASSPDRDGTELADLGAARVEAVRLVAGLLNEQTLGRPDLKPLCVEVVDEGGMTAFRVEIGFVYPSPAELQSDLTPFLR